MCVCVGGGGGVCSKVGRGTGLSHSYRPKVWLVTMTDIIDGHSLLKVTGGALLPMINLLFYTYFS